jgi:hypothetical protein
LSNTPPRRSLSESNIITSIRTKARKIHAQPQNDKIAGGRKLAGQRPFDIPLGYPGVVRVPGPESRMQGAS